MKINSIIATVVGLVSSTTLAAVIELKVTASGGKYFLNGVRTPVVEVKVGDTLLLDLNDSSVRSHPLYLTEVADSREVFAGAASNNRTISLEVTEDTPGQLFYSCSRHGGMGGEGSILVVD
jgi:plastocyanin